METKKIVSNAIAALLDIESELKAKGDHGLVLSVRQVRDSLIPLMYEGADLP
jgi:hypothetical protein